MHSKSFFIVFILLSSSYLPCLAVEMVFVEGGNFIMGDPEKNEEHKVTLDSFYISKYEITFKDLMGYGETQSDGTEDPLFLESLDPDYLNKEDYPVTGLTWYDYRDICNWLSEKEGLEPVYEKGPDGVTHWENNGYRLLTEAEWEYAARGGQLSKGYEYPGSNSINEVAWYTFNSKPHTHPVGQKKPNELGIYDMGGNVWERCDNLWEKYTNEEVTNPKGRNNYDRDENPRGYVVRGGSFSNMPQYVRSLFRTFDQYRIDESIGFRVCRSSNQ